MILLHKAFSFSPSCKVLPRLLSAVSVTAGFACYCYFYSAVQKFLLNLSVNHNLNERKVDFCTVFSVLETLLHPSGRQEMVPVL